jgi:hypothetical protein
MFSGGEYEEVARWMRNFVASHAKRENLRVEPEVDAEGPREGQSYGIRLRLGAALSPAFELTFADVAENRGSLAWCAELAGRVRALARELPGTSSTPLRTA